MRWFIIFALLSWFIWRFSTVVLAESQPVVLRGMSAVPTEGSEWIALENITAATVSAQTWTIRDVQGSIKSWLVPTLQPYELRMFSSTETKISLNNTGDQVELLQGITVVQSSAPYEELQAGNVWVLLSNGWKELEQQEWESRWPVRDWQVPVVVPLPTPTPVIVPSPTVVPIISPSPIPFKVSPLPSPSMSIYEKSWWEQVSLPTVGLSSTQSAKPQSTPPIWERPPGNYDDEWRSFQNWKKDIWIRLGTMFFASFFSLMLSAPKLYRCYNDLCLLDDG